MTNFDPIPQYNFPGLDQAIMRTVLEAERITGKLHGYRLVYVNDLDSMGIRIEAIQIGDEPAPARCAAHHAPTNNDYSTTPNI